MKRNNRKTQTILSVLIVLAFGAGSFAQGPPPQQQGGRGPREFFAGPEVRFANKVVKGVPYSAQAVTETNQTLSDGNQIQRTFTVSLYRDSEGRTRREGALGEFGPMALQQGNAQPMVLINDPVAGAHYILNPAAHTARKLPAQGPGGMMQRHGQAGGPPPPPGQGADASMMPPPPPGGGEGGRGFGKQLAAEGGTVQTEPLGSQTIGGVQADGTRVTVTIPVGVIGNQKPIQIVTERWYSSQLQTTVMSKRTDPRVGVTTFTLTNINLAEPPAALFQVPPGYTVQDAPFPHHFNQGTNQNGSQ